MEKLKQSLFRFMLNTPPYAHPELNPNKELKRMYYLKKRYDKDENYIEVH